MEQVLIFIIGVILGGVLGGGVVWVFLSKKIKELEVELKRTEKEIEEERTLLRSCELRTGEGGEKIAFGLGEFNQKVQEIKESRKQKILEEIKEEGKLQTNQTADLLEVSRATAFRYLEELEKEGKIEQIGAFGRNVEYKIKGN